MQYVGFRSLANYNIINLSSKKSTYFQKLGGNLGQTGQVFKTWQVFLGRYLFTMVVRKSCHRAKSRGDLYLVAT